MAELPAGFMLDPGETSLRLAPAPPAGFMVDASVPPGFSLDSGRTTGTVLPRTPFSLNVEQLLAVRRTPAALDEARALWGEDLEKATAGLGPISLSRGEEMAQLHAPAPGEPPAEYKGTLPYTPALAAPKPRPEPVEGVVLSPLEEALGVTPQNKVVTDYFAQQAQMQLAGSDVSESGALYRGGYSGLQGLKGTGYALYGLAQKLLGDEEGMRDAFDTVMLTQAKQAAVQPKYMRVEDLVRKGSLGDYISWLGFNLGEQATNIATVVLGGGGGAYLGRKLAELKARGIVSDEVARQLVAKFSSSGAKVGALASASALETGATASEQYAATGTVQPAVALGAGFLKGLLEQQTPLVLAGRLGISPKLGNQLYNRILDQMATGGLIRRTAGGAVTTFAAEATTEAAQEMIDIAARKFVDENYRVLGPEAASRVLNAAAVGGFTGGALGGAIGAITPYGGAPGPAVTTGLGGLPLDARGRVVDTGAPLSDEQLRTIFATAPKVRGEEATTAETILAADVAAALAQQIKGAAPAVATTPETQVSQPVKPGVQPKAPTAAIPAAEPQALQALPATKQEVKADAARFGGFAAAEKLGLAIIQRNAARKADAAGNGTKAAELYRLATNNLDEAQKLGYKLAMPEPAVVTKPMASLREEFATLSKQAQKMFATVAVIHGGVAEHRALTNVTHGGGPLPREWALRELTEKGFLETTVETAADGTTSTIYTIPSKRQIEGGIVPVANYARSAVKMRSDELDRNVDLRETLDTMVKGQVLLWAPNAKLADPTSFDSRLRSLAEEVMGRFFPNTRLVIDRSPDSSLADPAANGVFYGFEDGSMAIWLRTQDEAGVPYGEQRMLNTFFHEIGHAVMHQHWWNLKSDEQAAIYEAWQAHLTRNWTTGVDVTQDMFMRDFFSPITYFHRAIAFGSEFRKLSTRDLMASGGFPEFGWYSFDEWMAEQTARWFTSSQKPLTLADKFFKGIASNLRAIAASFGLLPKDTEPAAVVKRWLDALYERRAANLAPISLSGSSVQESIVENAKALDVAPNFWEAPPAQPENIQFRKSAQALGLPRRTLAQMDKFSWWKKATWGLLQLADKNKHIIGLQSYTEAIRAWHIEKMQLVSRADHRLRQWRGLGKEMAQNLSNFLFDLDAEVYLPAGANHRWPTTAELVALAKKHNINRSALALYFEIKNDFSEVLNRVQLAWEADAASIQDPVQRAIKMQEIAAEMAHLRAAPYFPHERFGRFAVLAKEPNGQKVYFSLHRTEREQKAVAEVVQRQFPTAAISQTKMPEEMQIYKGVPPAMLKNVAQKLNLTAQQAEWLDMLAFDLSPANSFAKRMKLRKNTPGYSLDGMRNYASYFLHAGSHIARLKYGELLKQSIGEVRRSAFNSQPGQLINMNRRSGIADWMQRHHDYNMDPQNEWAGLRSLTFQWFLGFNVSSAMMNLTQVPMVAWPYLSARYNDVSALNELRRAATDVHKLYRLRQGSLPTDELAAIKLGVEQGFLDESQAMELATVAENGALGRVLPGSAMQRGVMTLGHYGAYVFQEAEKFNRRIVFRAAYRLAKQKPNARYNGELQAANSRLFLSLTGAGWTTQNALAFLAARDAVERTQFEYARWARPEFMRGKKGVAFTFFMFTQNMLWFFKNSPGGGRALGMMLLAAGIMGLPGAEDMSKVLRFILTKYTGRFVDLETEVRRLVKPIADEIGVNPDLFMHGLGRESFGLKWAGEMLGVPVPGFDLSGRIGMGQVVPGVDALTNVTRDPTDNIAKFAQDIGGPTFSIPFAVYKALASQNPDVWRTMESALPAAARNLSRAMRWVTRGEETDTTGVQLASFDPLDTKKVIEVVGQALGYAPTRLRRMQDQQLAKYEAYAYWKMRREALFAEYDLARRMKDREGVADVKEWIAEFNRSVPDNRMRITFGDLRASFEAREQRRELIERGKAPQKMLQGITSEINQLYPTEEPGS